MDSGSDTPEGFLHETKFVVLSYLGLVPPDFDPGFSEFDIHSSGSSHPQTPFSIPGSGSEEGSHSASPRFLSVRSRYGLRSQSFSPSSVKSRSPALSPRGSQKRQREKVKVEHDEVRTTVDTVTCSGATGHVEADKVEESLEISKVSPDDRVGKDNPNIEIEKVKVEHGKIHTSVDLVTSSGATEHVEVDVIQESVAVYELSHHESSTSNGVTSKGDDDLEVDAAENGEECKGEDEEEQDATGTTTTTTVETTVEALLPLETGAAPEINIGRSVSRSQNKVGPWANNPQNLMRACKMLRPRA